MILKIFRKNKKKSLILPDLTLEIRNHYRAHTLTARVKCEICGKTFSEVANLKRHFKMKHD